MTDNDLYPYKSDPLWIHAKARQDAAFELHRTTHGEYGLGHVVSASMDMRERENFHLNHAQEALDYFAGMAKYAIDRGFGSGPDGSKDELDTASKHLMNLGRVVGSHTAYRGLEDVS